MVLNICEYVFSVSSIFVCPKNLVTKVTLAPLLINSDAHERLKSCNLIDFKFAASASFVLLSYMVESAIGLASDATKKLSLKLQYSVHDILDKSKNVNNSYYLSIIDKMYNDGYFKKGYHELTDEHANKNYDKAIRWIEKGIIPQFLLDDMNEYIKTKTQINNKETLRIESC